MRLQVTSATKKVADLTEAVRRRPYCVVLLDEMEKAHQDVFNILLQVLDDGRLTDNQGHTVDFRNTIIIMTSNIGSHSIQRIAEEGGDIEEMKEAVTSALQGHFLPEFLNRIDETIVFHPLRREEIRRIVDLQVARLQARIAEHGINLQISDPARSRLAAQGYDPAYGARPLKRVIQQRLENPLATELLKGDFEPGDTIRVNGHEDGFTFEKVPGSTSQTTVETVAIE